MASVLFRAERIHKKPHHLLAFHINGLLQGEFVFLQQLVLGLWLSLLFLPWALAGGGRRRIRRDRPFARASFQFGVRLCVRGGYALAPRCAGAYGSQRGTGAPGTRRTRPSASAAAAALDASAARIRAGRARGRGRRWRRGSGGTRVRRPGPPFSLLALRGWGGIRPGAEGSLWRKSRRGGRRPCAVQRRAGGQRRSGALHAASKEEEPGRKMV